MSRQIIALGGGGFSMEPQNLAIDDYVLQKANAGRPKVCFVPTASGDSADYVARFYRAFSRLHCQPSDLTLFSAQVQDVGGFLCAQDVIYVGGGNTLNMVAIWRAWGLDEVLRRAWEQGTVLAGISAGAICWFAEGLSDSRPGALTRVEGIGLLAGSFSPHYDGEAQRRPSFHRLLQEGVLGPGYAADDGAALHFVDTELAEVVSSRPAARAYHLTPQTESVLEAPLDARLLAPPAERA